VVTLAAFMEILDTTIVNVAPPHIAGSLASSNDEATWVLTSYLASNGIVLTISGWLSDVLGRKRYFLTCIAMFTVCSLAVQRIEQPRGTHRLPGFLRRRPSAQPAIDHP
jgi:MFS transporter, DHA2 family, multidrug resistance protein